MLPNLFYYIYRMKCTLMNKNLINLLAVFAITAILTSCAKTEDIVKSGSMTATVDSTSFVATQVSAKKSITPTGTVIIVTGNVRNITIDLRIAGYNDAPGTFIMTPASSSATYSSGSIAFEGDAFGQVVVTNGSSSNISGTFSFVTNDSLHIRNGSFQAVIQ